MDPAKDLVRGSNHEVFCLNGGLVVSGGRRRRDGHLPDRRAIGQPGAARACGATRAISSPAQPDVFVMLFNNVYSTNFAQWIEGSWSSRVRLWAPRRGRVDRRIAHRRFVGSPRRCLAAVSDAPPGQAAAHRGRAEHHEEISGRATSAKGRFTLAGCS